MQEVKLTFLSDRAVLGHSWGEAFFARSAENISNYVCSLEDSLASPISELQRYDTYLGVSHKNHLGVWASFRIVTNKSSQSSNSLGLRRDIRVQESRVLESFDVSAGDTTLYNRSNVSNDSGTSSFSASTRNNDVDGGTVRDVEGDSKCRHQGHDKSDDVHDVRMKSELRKAEILEEF